MSCRGLENQHLPETSGPLKNVLTYPNCRLLALFFSVWQISLHTHAVDYTTNISVVGGDYTLEGSQRSIELNPLGTNLSVNATLNEQWGLYASYTTQADNEQSLIGNVTAEIDHDATHLEIGASCNFGANWLSLALLFSESKLDLAGTVRNNGLLTYDEQTDFEVYSLQLGRQWQGNGIDVTASITVSWLDGDTTTSLTTPFQAQNTGNPTLLNLIDSLEGIVINSNEEALSGSELGLLFGLAWPYIDQRNWLWIGQTTLSYQQALSGDVITNSTHTTQSTTFTNLSSNSSETSNSNNDSEDQAYVDLTGSLLTQQWSFDMVFSFPVLNDPKDWQWRLGLGYAF